MISSAESNSIKYLRSLALIMIVLCHLFQAFGNRWAWVLNVGVQIFFVISGFLYGSMYIENYAKWGGRRFVKLYLPYAIYIVIVMPLYSYVYGYDYFIKSIIVHLSLLQGFGKLGGGRRLKSFVVFDSNCCMLFIHSNTSENCKI